MAGFALKAEQDSRRELRLSTEPVVVRRTEAKFRSNNGAFLLVLSVWVAVGGEWS